MIFEAAVVDLILQTHFIKSCYIKFKLKTV